MTKKRQDTRYKLVELTRGLVTAVSPEDYEAVMKFRWCASVVGNGYGMAQRCASPQILLSRFIAERIFGEAAVVECCVDHKNVYPFDNRRCNIRLATHTDNVRNSRHKKQGGASMSKYIGVRVTPAGRYAARISIKGESIHIGTFNTEKAAAIAYDNKAREVRGDFVVLNFPTAEECYVAPPKIIREQVPEKASSHYFGQRNRVGEYIRVSSHHRNFLWRLSHLGKLHYKHAFPTAREAALARDKYIEDNNLPHLKNFKQEKE